MNLWRKIMEIFTDKKIDKTFSLLFATSPNSQNIVSIERHRNRKETLVVFDKNKNEHYFISDEQHEDFIEQMSKKIECIVVTK